MKKNTLLYMTVLFTAFFLAGCGSDDTINEPETIEPDPDFSANLIGLWEFETPTELTGNALYFGLEGESYTVTYGDLNVTHLDPNPNGVMSYTIEDNIISGGYFDQPVPYDGSNEIGAEGVVLNKVGGADALDDLILPLEVDNSESVDISAFINSDDFNNLDGFGEELFVPNPGSDENRYLIFNKNDLSFIEAVPGIGENARSISIIDALLPLRSVLEDVNASNSRFRIYQNTNPAFHPPATTDILTERQANVHAVTNQSGFDFISYRPNENTFIYHDVDATNSQMSTEQFAFFETPIFTSIHGMDYVEGQNKLIFSDSFNLHVFNIGFSGGTGVSVFEHLQSYSITPQFFNGDIKGRIQGVYYDEDQTMLYLVIGPNSSSRLVKMDFQLPN